MGGLSSICGSILSNGPKGFMLPARSAFFMYVAFRFEYNEDDTGGRTEVEALPVDDVLQKLKKKDQSAGAGTI